MTISPSLAMHFGSADEKPTCAVAMQVEKIVGAGVMQAEKTVGAGAIEIDEPDFCVLFDASEKAWTVT